MVIDMLKSHLRDSETAVSSEAARSLMAERTKAEASKRAKDRIQSITAKFDWMRRDLDVGLCVFSKFLLIKSIGAISKGN